VTKICVGLARLPSSPDDVMASFDRLIGFVYSRLRLDQDPPRTLG
jgi:hypothetical protein